jgi:Cell Wall Hydrolase
MYFFRKAAPVAALPFILMTASAYSDAGLAWGANSDTALDADTIKIDPMVIADNDAAQSVSRTDPISKNPVIFAPGTGDFVPSLPKAEGDSDADIAAPREKPTASSLVALVGKYSIPADMDAETRCLAGAVYFESKGESLAGQLAVARVIMARAKSGRFPSSLCGVVYQKSQFSFIRGGKMPAIATGSAHWKNAVAISQIALDNSWKSPVEGALFFHARYVAPGWKLRRIGMIDNHIFYR